MLTVDDAPQWLKNESLRVKWAEINNARLRVWMPDEAPPYISAKWKREEWAQEKNNIEESDLTYIVPCTCDKCGAEFEGTDPGVSGAICTHDREMQAVGVRRRKHHYETDCVLCISCYAELRAALQEFETRWIHESDLKSPTPL